MADVQLSGIGIVDINGSVGQTTFARNYYGIYAKQRIGAPAGSTFLTDWNNEVGSLTAVWTFGMTDTDRQEWYKVSRYKQDAMAQRIRITGFDLFMSVNLNLFLIGGMQTNVPPIYTPAPQISSFTITTASIVLLKITPDWANMTECAVFVSWGLSPGRMSNTQIYAYIGHAPYPFAPNVVYTTVNNRVGNLIIGEKRFVKLIPINQTTGQRGQPQYASAIIS